MSIDVTTGSLRDPWEGDTKIVIGIDIGPTYSGVAFTLLQNGENQTIHRVTNWPGQEAQRQQSRIPTLVWYNQNAKAMACGAEALLCTIEEEAEDNGWMLARYFKLHLHPSDMQARHELKLDPLPHGVSLRQIYSDFLGYLLKHTKSYFEECILDGKNIWEQHSPAMEVVIAHPNGWGIREQAFLRSAAVAAGFATAEEALSKIRFVTEAEASVHFCIHHTNMGSVLRPGMNFAVCDAGGSTVNTIIYGTTSARPILKLEEKRASACVQAGAIFVDFEAEKYLRRTLSGAGLDSEDVAEYTRVGVRDFEGFAKRAFRDETTEQSICIAHSRFNNAGIRVRRGRMILSGSTVKGFFDVCVKEIMSSVDQQMVGLDVPIILLVGGFGDSPYLRQELQKRYRPRGSQIVFTNDSTSKAVADGAVLWAVACGLMGRVLRFSWGIETSVSFDPNDPDHLERKEMVTDSGWAVLPGKWRSLAKKGILLKDNHVAMIPFSFEFPSSEADLGKFELDLYNYTEDDEPVWIRNEQGQLLQNFSIATTIQANLENLRGALDPHIASGGVLQWQLDFDVCIRFGDETLVVYLEWEEKGQRRSGSCICVNHKLDWT